MWDVYNLVLHDQQRTNNAMEGWHNQFQKLMTSPPLLVEVYDTLKDEEQQKEHNIIQLLEV